MSTTRSPSPKAPATRPGAWRDATLLLVGLGSSRTDAPAASFERHAQSLRECGLFAGVRAGCILGDPPARGIFDRVETEEAYVVPLLMSEGPLARKAIPALIRAATAQAGAAAPRFKQARPVGVDPEIAALALDRALGACADAGLDPRATTLVLAAHGSTQSGESRRATLRQIVLARRSARFKAVAPAFLDEEPFVRNIVRDHAPPAVVASLFAADGPHAMQDVPDALRGHAGFVDAGPVGIDPRIVGIVLARIAACDRSSPRADATKATARS
ncbi:MAG: hypothetical protein JNK11_04500 [Alphaproteobacteria bacterium]|nr:hypothetical protein [Alphaproteobacteria bacterium]